MTFAIGLVSERVHGTFVRLQMAPLTRAQILGGKALDANDWKCHPIKWAILGIEGAVWRGFTLGEMMVPCAILLGFGAVCFAVGVRGLGDA